ncbi:hypothetical protein [Flavobacterium sp. IB48]|uniref:hypothetical protein n=1 Tax=Flavobacterium sp. IB48 TaxID=2779375 RepID=UPI0018E82C37|nr:hypothetical protein [Flavobacterium sp. IB48]MBJ2124677.1 hypothetical protein [Flavobacterium sp. IB48]
MNKYTAIKLSEHYKDSVRTSGEVIGEFVRDKEVICKLILFIGAKVHYFFISKTKNLNSNIFFTFCEYKEKQNPIIIYNYRVLNILQK